MYKRGRGERGDQLFQMEAEAAVGKRVEEGEAEIKPCIMYPSGEGGGTEGEKRPPREKEHEEEEDSLRGLITRTRVGLGR